MVYFSLVVSLVRRAFNCYHMPLTIAATIAERCNKQKYKCKKRQEAMKSYNKQYLYPTKHESGPVSMGRVASHSRSGRVQVIEKDFYKFISSRTIWGPTTAN